MKKIQLLKTINETTTKKMVMDEESYFEGYDFKTNGHEMHTYDSNITNGELIKRSINVKWKLKFIMGHDGVYGSTVEIKSVVAAIEQNGQNVPLNLNGFGHNIVMEKNPEVDQMQILLTSIFIDVVKKEIKLIFKT
jgi:hypothetical protein